MTIKTTIYFHAHTPLQFRHFTLQFTLNKTTLNGIINGQYISRVRFIFAGDKEKLTWEILGTGDTIMSTLVLFTELNLHIDGGRQFDRRARPSRYLACQFFCSHKLEAAQCVSLPTCTQKAKQ